MTAAIDDPSVARPPVADRSTRGRAFALAGLALVAGLGIGRFVTYGDDGGSTPAAAVGATTPEAQIASLEQAVADRPKDPLAWQELGSTYVRLAIATGNPEFFSGAERALARAEKLDPTSPVTMVAKGTFALTLHRFPDALRLGQAAEAAAPFNAEAKAVTVDALVELGRLDEAAAKLQELLELRPGLAALTRVSYLRQLTGDLDGALAAMQQAQSSAPPGLESGAAAALGGEIQLLRGDLDGAEAAFRQSLRASPGLVAGELGLGKLRASTGDPEGALDGVAAAFAESGAPGLAVLQGELLEASGRTAAAEDAYEAARQVYRDEVTAGAVVDLEVAYLEADHGSPAEALAAAVLAYDARPGIYTADARAWSLFRNGRFADAVPYSEESLEKGTLDAALRVHAAAVFHAAGRADQARATLAPALELGGFLPLPLRTTAAELVGALDVSLPRSWQ